MRGLAPAACCTVDVAEEGCHSSSSWSLQGVAGLLTQMRACAAYVEGGGQAGLLVPLQLQGMGANVDSQVLLP